MGYLIAAVLLVLVLLVVVSAIKPGSKGEERLNTDHPVHPVELREPAADEPTPGQSAIADAGTARRAQRRVPPA